MRLIVLVLFLLCGLLSPGRVQAQAYTGTSTTVSYGMFNGQNALYLFGEFFYSTTGSGSYQWAGNGSIQFSVSVTKYSSQENLESNNPISTNTTLWNCTNGEWMVQQWNSTTARISGAKYLTTLEEGFLYVVTATPRANGSYRPSYYAQFSSFQWVGTPESATIDLIHPGDGE